MDRQNIKSHEGVLQQYNKNSKKQLLFMLVLVGAIISVSVIAIMVGPLEMTVRDVYRVLLHKIVSNMHELPNEQIIGAVWYVRLPRLLTSILVGSSLAIAGAVMQPILRNPMASPFTLGISSGAGLGAAIAIILGKGITQGPHIVVGNAFILSLLTSLTILLIAKKKGTRPEMMVLIGVALSHLFTGCTTVMQYFADSWAVEEVLFWMVGSLSKGTWQSLKIMFPINSVCIMFLIVKSWDLNFISIGDEAAKSLGVNVDRTRIILMLVASLLTATTICFTGAIGFIGLVAPHITRMVIGGDNRIVVPASGLVGALLLILGDLVAMNILRPVVIPIGIMTSFMGVPLFILLILRARKGVW